MDKVGVVYYHNIRILLRLPKVTMNSHRHGKVTTSFSVTSAHVCYSHVGKEVDITFRIEETVLRRGKASLFIVRRQVVFLSPKNLTLQPYRNVWAKAIFVYIQGIHSVFQV